MHYTISPSSAPRDFSCSSPSHGWSSPQSLASYKVRDSSHPQLRPPAVPRPHHVANPASPYAQPPLVTPLAPRISPAYLPHPVASPSLSPLSSVYSSSSTTSDTTLSFSLHPALKLNNIQFNIMVEPPIPQFHPALGAVDLRMHATSLPVLQIFIKIAELPFTFVVQNMDGVRIQDVLQTIRRELLSGVSYSELCYVPDQAQRAANQLSRLRHLQNPGRQGGILRVDCLGSRTNFVGLNRDPSTKGTWVADFTC